VETWINPLAFLEIDEPWASSTPKPVTLEAVVDFATAEGLAHDIPSLVARYREISIEEPRLFAVPADDRVLARLVWPLRHAKASYMLGNYLGTISLCGLASEMAAILIFETGEVRVNGALMDLKKQQAMFGSSFEKLGQDRRVSVLRAYNLVDEPLADAFNAVRLARRRYLHLWSQEHDDLARDAVAAFVAATKLIVTAVGHSLGEGGRFRLTPAIARYLARTESDDDDGESSDG
jgi:hypothetical protein